MTSHSMSRILGNAKRLVMTPGMLSAYSSWIMAHTFFGRGPAVDCTESTQISNWLNFSEYWSFHRGIPKSEKILMRKCLKSKLCEQVVAIDVGANIGLFTIELASIGYNKIHAFEPIPKTFSRLKENVVKNQLTGRVILNRLAVGVEEGITEFQIFENSPAINRLINSSAETSVKQQGSLVQQVPVTSLDKYCKEHEIKKINFLKVDVEGMEPFVIQGACELLKEQSISTILLEICPDNLEIVGNSIHGLYKTIVKFGYLPHRLLESGDIGEVLTIDELQSVKLANVVVTPA